MRLCRFCTGVGTHFLTCKLLKLQPGWQNRLTERDDDDDDGTDN